MNINNPEKLKTIVIPIINDRKAIMQSVSAVGNDALTQAMEAAIPKEAPKTISGSNLASTMLAIHTAMKRYLESERRSNCKASSYYLLLWIMLYKQQYLIFKMITRRNKDLVFRHFQFNRKVGTKNRMDICLWTVPTAVALDVGIPTWTNQNEEPPS